MEDRSRYYLIEEFNRFCRGRLDGPPSWEAWCVLVAQWSELGASAFAGKTNLHQHADLIARVADVYEALRLETLDAAIDSE